MDHVICLPFEKSLEQQTTVFLLENNNYALEPCRNVLQVPPDEACNYFKYGLKFVFSSPYHYSSVAIDQRTKKIVGMNTSYITTLPELLERYSNSLHNNERWPSMTPLFAMQVELFEKAMPTLLKDYANTRIMFGDFTLLDRDYWLHGIAMRMTVAGYERAKHDAILPDTYLGISNSPLGRRDGAMEDVMQLKYSEFMYDGKRPFAAFGDEHMVLRGALLKPKSNASLAKL